MHKAMQTPGPVAVINKRKMAVGVAGIEGISKGHDVIPAGLAIAHLRARGHDEAASIIEAQKKDPCPYTFKGSGGTRKKNRALFGEIVCDILDGLPTDELQEAAGQLHAVCRPWV